MQLSPINEQDEYEDNTAIASSKVSQICLMTMPFCSFRISTQSYYNSEASTSDCSAVPCILAGGHEAEQRRTVSDVQPTVGKPPGNVIAISGQDELDGCSSCDSSEDTAFPEALKRSEAKNEEVQVLAGASMSTSSIIREWKGVNRPLYGRLQKHKGRRSSFSNRKSKRTMLKRRYSNLQNHCK